MIDPARRKDNLKRTSALGGVLLLAGLFALTPRAVTAEQKATARLVGQVAYSHTSPPSSGVKLLEDIFMRVRSAPQIAMARNMMKQQSQAAVDPLAIRPKGGGGTERAIPMPSLAIMPNGASGYFAPNLPGSAGGGGSGIAPVSNVPAQEPIIQQLRAGKSFPLLADAPKPTAPGVWESSASSSAENERRVQVKPLAQTAQNLMGALATLQNAQTYGNNLQRQRESAKADAYSRADEEGDSSAVDTIAQRKSEIVVREKKKASSLQSRAQFAFDDQIVSKMRREEKPSKDVRDAAPMAAPATATMSNFGGIAAAPSSHPRGGLIPPPPAVLSLAKNASNGATPPAEIASSNGASPAAAPRRGIIADKTKIAMGEIALLPPNVVTGIPLVRLGSSENQARGALQAIGSMKHEKVSKWTVSSWSRPQTRTGTSLQLYIRNGLLDAMRIFDSSLIGSDFGVNVGDNLGRVKEKFGEPAFILQEPGPGAGMNYVYPISQIGFQLARPQPGEQPRVVSVLIFNVK